MDVYTVTRVYENVETKTCVSALADGGYKILIEETVANTLTNLNAAINADEYISDVGTNPYQVKITGHGINTNNDYLIYNTKRTS